MMKRKKLPPGTIDLGDGSTLNLEVESPPKRPAPEPPKPKRKTDPEFFHDKGAIPEDWDLQVLRQLLKDTPATYRDTRDKFVLKKELKKHLVMDAGDKPNLPVTNKQLDEQIRDAGDDAWHKGVQATEAWMRLNEQLAAAAPGLDAIRAGAASLWEAVRAANRANKRTIELYAVRTAVVRGLIEVGIECGNRGKTWGDSRRQFDPKELRAAVKNEIADRRRKRGGKKQHGDLTAARKTVESESGCSFSTVKSASLGLK